MHQGIRTVLSRAALLLAVAAAAASVAWEYKPVETKYFPVPAPSATAQPCADTHVPRWKKGDVVPIPQNVLGAMDNIKGDACLLRTTGKLTALEDEQLGRYLFAGEYKRSGIDAGDGWNECETGRIAFGRGHVIPFDKQDATDRANRERIFGQQ